ncbi:MAG: HDOD domain-containing protein [Treponema sp.]|nr:HDOD domain-containing protein [Treponema sp.]
MAQAERIEVDVSKIRKAIQSGIPLTITTYTLPHEMEDYIADVLKVFLTEVRQDQMVESLSYCLKELVNNAKKANTKRIYFEEKGLDINKRSDYVKGMQTFKQDTIDDIDHYLQAQKDRGLYIKTIMQTRNNKIRVEVRNKAVLTYYEYKRVHDKITRAQQYKSVEDGLAQLLDDSEGAGLGLVIMILVLKKIGLGEDSYQIFTEGGETVTRLTLPFNDKMCTDISELSSRFVAFIDGLPEFPENINEINKVINNPDSKMSDIAMKISTDVSLTAELLKLVNSATFALASPCHSIGDAVKLVGIRGIKNLLYSIGSVKILSSDDDTEHIKELWDHSYQVAFYSYNLARSFCREAGEKAFVDDSYVCGLLHDMGKIIFETAHPDIMEKVDGICVEYGLSTDLFERLVAGVNHGEIGAKVARKWNFPDMIVNTIRYHHSPETAPLENRMLAEIVCIADSLAHYQSGDIEYDQMEIQLMRRYGIQSEDDVKAIVEKLDKAMWRDRAKAGI